jgi:TfoX/Sxy family transcriptional regulator of competence genes
LRYAPCGVCKQEEGNKTGQEAPTAYDMALDGKVADLVEGWGNLQKKTMFGGMCHLLNGNMFAGVRGNELILRVGEEEAGKALRLSGVRPFDMTGRPMRGWVVVEPAGYRTDDELSAWLERARRFAVTLPKKQRTKAGG